MGRVPMVLLDRLEVPVDLVAHLSKVHQDQALVSIDHLECNFTVVHLDRRARDLLAAHLDTLVDLQETQEELNLALNGIDRQECIMGLRDHQVSLNINICKGRSLAKVHHREDLLQVLWVVREARLRDMVDHRRDLLKDRQVVRHLMSIRHSSPKDHLISIPANIHQDLPVHLMVHLTVHLTVLLMVLLMVPLTDNHMDRRMYRHMVTDHRVHKHLTEHPDLIIVRKVRLRSRNKNSRR